MRKILSVLLVLAALIAVPAFAVGPMMVDPHTAAWDPNTESDLGGYYVYYRPVTTPATAWDNSRRSALVAVSPTPRYNLLTIISANGTYEIAVSAIDTSNNESGLSVSVPFVVDLPSVPRNSRVIAP